MEIRRLFGDVWMDRKCHCKIDTEGDEAERRAGGNVETEAEK